MLSPKMILLLAALRTATGYVMTPSARAPLSSAPAFARGGARTALRMDLEGSFDGWGMSSASAYYGGATAGYSTAPVFSHVASSSFATADSSGSSWLPTRSAFATLDRPLRASTATFDRPQAGRSAHTAAEAPAPERLRTAAALRKRLQASSSVPTVVMFGARTCRACRAIQPKLERLASKAGARFLYLHHDRLSDDAFNEYEVSETPTTFVYDALGNEVSREVYSAKELPQLAAVLNTLQEGSIVWGI